MIRSITYLIPLFLAVTPLTRVIAEAPNAAESTPSIGSMPMWELAMPNGETLYLVGSIHLLRPDAYPLPEAIESAFDASPEVVFETDMKAMQSPALLMKMMQLGMYQDGTTLADHISPEAFTAYNEFLKSQGLPAAMFARYKPWMAGVTLSVLAMQKAGFDANLGLESHFQRRADEAGKPVSGLEEPTFQVELLASLADGQEEAFLMQTLTDLEQLPDMFDTMDAAWRNGQMQDLAELLNESFQEFPELMDRLLTARNLDWAEKLESRIESGKSAFVVVGAGHLAGEKNLVDLLRAKGYTIRQR